MTPFSFARLHVNHIIAKVYKWWWLFIRCKCKRFYHNVFHMDIIRCRTATDKQLPVNLKALERTRCLIKNDLLIL